MNYNQGNFNQGNQVNFNQNDFDQGDPLDFLDKAFKKNIYIGTIVNVIIIIIFIVLYFVVYNGIKIKKNETEQHAIKRLRTIKNTTLIVGISVYIFICLVQTSFCMSYNGFSTIWYFIIYLFGPLFGIIYLVFGANSGTGFASI